MIDFRNVVRIANAQKRNATNEATGKYTVHVYIYIYIKNVSMHINMYKSMCDYVNIMCVCTIFTPG